MLYQLGVEDIEPNHWVAFVFDHPGCFSSAMTQEETVAQAPARIAEYFAWLSRRGRTIFLPNTPIRAQVVEVFRSFVSEGNYVVNAFFEDDRRTLTRDEVDDALRLLDYSRRDLLALIQQISPEELNQPMPGEAQGSAAGILDHIAWAEWWYFDRLNLAFPREEMPEDPFAKLAKVRALTRAQMPRLIGDDRVVEKIGEQWSARKVLRRTLWHERDHTQHIRMLTKYRY
jgi:predicted RNase H-like HicB family nuclease